MDKFTTICMRRKSPNGSEEVRYATVEEYTDRAVARLGFDFYPKHDEQTGWRFPSLSPETRMSLICAAYDDSEPGFKHTWEKVHFACQWWIYTAIIVALGMLMVYLAGHVEAMCQGAL